jgi:carbon storage regulator
MLVLSRQRDQTIMIGDDIEVTIVDIRGDKVRLGINAPKEMPVHRKEVYDAIKKGMLSARQKREAAQQPPEPPAPPHVDPYMEREHQTAKEKNPDARGKDETP